MRIVCFESQNDIISNHIPFKKNNLTDGHQMTEWPSTHHTWIQYKSCLCNLAKFRLHSIILVATSTIAWFWFNWMQTEDTHTVANELEEAEWFRSSCATRQGNRQKASKHRLWGWCGGDNGAGWGYCCLQGLHTKWQLRWILQGGKEAHAYTPTFHVHVDNIPSLVRSFQLALIFSFSW